MPNLFRAQTLRPESLAAQASAVETILLTTDVLSREQKELILLVASAANLNTYCVALHGQVLQALGVPEEVPDQVAADHHRAGLKEAEVTLLDFARKLALSPGSFGSGDITGLKARGFTESQVLEAVVLTAFAQFLNSLQMGLGTVPDFPPRTVFSVNLSGSLTRQTVEGDERSPGRNQVQDADSGLVARAKCGDVDAFEELVRRHQGRVYRTLLGITGDTADAEDGAQRAFMKAFQRLGSFEGASTFSTWLTRIAINEGLERLRGRKSFEQLGDETDEERGFSPRQIKDWRDSPEEAYVKAELKAIVERELLKLPPVYRAAVLLRDLEELSTVEAATALGLAIPTLKTRLLRGRLLLREALTPYFARRAETRPV